MPAENKLIFVLASEGRHIACILSLHILLLSLHTKIRYATSYVRTACPKLSTSMQQAGNNLFCNNIDVDIIGLVARLFQQV